MVKCLYFLLFLSTTAFACDVSFSVKRENNIPVKNAVIIVNNKKLSLNVIGSSNAVDLTEGVYTVYLYENDVLIDSQIVNINCNTIHYQLTIPSQTIKSLEEVVVSSQSIKQKLENSPFSVQVIDMKKQYDRSGDIGNLLNRSAGIKVRNNGNLGSTVQINLGGLQGKAIRIFKDGIPIELFGHGFNIGTIPTNMLERVEVYKGSMPVYLASDALGGGINLITRNPKSNLMEVSYEVGSFNTHRATANMFFTGKNPSYYIGLNTSYNYSDNRYTINAPFINPETGQKYYKDVKRFHDATKSYYGELFAGIRDKKWADDFRLSLLFSDFYKEIQNDSEMGKVYGKPFNKEQNYAVLLSHKKELFDNRLKINSTVNYSRFNTKLIDTATVRYNWDGDIILENQITGEINKGGSNQRLHYDLFSTRISAAYEFYDNHFVELGELFYYQRRKGSDPLGAVSPVYDIDVLTIPATYKKNIAALAFRSLWLDKKVESIVAIKHYNSHTEGFTTDKFLFAWQSSKSNSQLGYLGGLKWNNDHYMVKMSYEYATRLPDEFEVFGDGVLIKENLDLTPEKSHNINLNAQYSFGQKKNNGMIATNLFYRRVKDAIFLQPDIPYNRYINFHEVEIKGVEIEATYNINNHVDFGFNATYQDIRRVNERNEFKIYEGSRVPNIPFLFGNVFLNGHLANVLKTKDRFSLRWNLNYLHRFYLTAIPKNQEPPLFGEATDVDSKLIIPNDGRLGQLSHDIGLYYQFADKKIRTSFEVLNVGNTKLYDNFNVQKPGRSAHFKIVYNFF
ncbi:TonB-dependent receptor plug domain-containing protein [Flavobacterium sp.]|uniref:TonB-dependent receptor plug domain-containing protein n=1 Tax=Flavobacterium sp. TaxID=239 RepID=UPI002621AD02|nr:TonB-dependent receptor plug domain-containing protein [Flavobacterium sp.]